MLLAALPGEYALVFVPASTDIKSRIFYHVTVESVDPILIIFIVLTPLFHEGVGYIDIDTYIRRLVMTHYHVTGVM
jgi:hypothetical protein